jgi:hypothetical protein
MAEAKVGRPTVFTPDTKDLLLEYIEAGMGNDEACRMLGVGPQNFYLTLSRDPDFRERYEAAKAASVEKHIDDADAAAHEARGAVAQSVPGLKLFVDHKWRLASRLAPQRWGEKATVNVTGAIVMDDTELAKRAAFLIALNGEGPGDAEPSEDDGSDLA